MKYIKLFFILQLILSILAFLSFQQNIYASEKGKKVILLCLTKQN